MNQGIEYKIFEILFVVIGIYLIFNYKRATDAAIKQRKQINKFLGIKLTYGNDQQMITELGYLIGGVIFTLLGLLAFFNVIHFR